MRVSSCHALPVSLFGSCSSCEPRGVCLSFEWPFGEICPDGGWGRGGARSGRLRRSRDREAPAGIQRGRQPAATRPAETAQPWRSSPGAAWRGLAARSKPATVCRDDPIGGLPQAVTKVRPSAGRCAWRIGAQPTSTTPTSADSYFDADSNRTVANVTGLPRPARRANCTTSRLASSPPAS